jgi:serine/threonine protein kinase
VTPERWRRLQALYEGARALEPAGRSAYLAGECPDDPTLRREVHSLLLAVSEGGRVDAALEEAFAVLPEPGPGSRVGSYRLESRVGEGGMGAVYMALRDDDEYRKRVAVKLVRGRFVGDEMLRRFRHERQILASLDHPNIARLLDGGTTEAGLPYLVMEYVEGGPSRISATAGGSACGRGWSCSASCARRWPSRTRTSSSTATSSRATYWSARTACRSCWTSGSRSSSLPARPGTSCARVPGTGC